LTNWPDVFDVVIIGGGINGCGCAADAALRGLSVLLVEQDDLASKTSSSSTKLIHGGLRYLEYHDFKLVKKALNERQMLLQVAPHLVHPLPIVLPYEKTMRPAWLLRAGLFLYDHLSRSNKLPASKLIRRKTQASCFGPLTGHLNKGFLFHDCMTDDARLTMANALQAREHGAIIMTDTALIQAETSHNQWQLTLQSKTSTPFTVTAKTVINTAGPWVEPVNRLLNIPMEYNLSLIKGSHIVVHKLYEGEHAYLLQHHDKRVVFVIPWHGHTLIGTTDVPLAGNPDDIGIDTGEMDYLLELTSRYFNKQIHPDNIISTWSGARPLLSTKGKNPAALSRDYTYHFATSPAPSVTVYGGKITTYRQLAHEVIDQLRSVFPKLPDSATQHTPLPGALFGSMHFNAYQEYAREKYHWLDDPLLTRYLGQYGTRTELLLQDCKCIKDLGLCFSEMLYQAEVDYLIREEWARTCEDILWRRTKLGYSMNADEQHMLAKYIRESNKYHVQKCHPREGGEPS
jgi:glycerol-3-phosphate dehydrogenase